MSWQLRNKRTGIPKVSSVPPIKPLKPLKRIQPIRPVKLIAPVGNEYYWKEDK